MHIKELSDQVTDNHHKSTENQGNANNIQSKGRSWKLLITTQMKKVAIVALTALAFVGAFFLTLPITKLLPPLGFMINFSITKGIIDQAKYSWPKDIRIEKRSPLIN